MEYYFYQSKYFHLQLVTCNWFVGYQCFKPSSMSNIHNNIYFNGNKFMRMFYICFIYNNS